MPSVVPKRMLLSHEMISGPPVATRRSTIFPAVWRTMLLANTESMTGSVVVFVPVVPETLMTMEFVQFTKVLNATVARFTWK